MPRWALQHVQFATRKKDEVTLNFWDPSMPTSCSCGLAAGGVSGPAALKLSAFGARVLNEGGYRGKLVVNWMAGNNPSKVK